MKYTKRTIAAIITGLAITFGAACTPEQVALYESIPGHKQEAVLAHLASNTEHPVVKEINERSNLSDSQLHRLAKCESTNNPQAVSKSGKYHGLYQFDQRTWNGVASSTVPEYVGTKPSRAPSKVQNAMARKLYESRGRSPWPHCGKLI